MPNPILIQKADGDLEPFNEMKLRESLMNAGAHPRDASSVIEHIKAELREGMTTSLIYKHAFHVLRGIARPIAARYSLKRALLGFGPSGFPFETYVAELFKAKGYTVHTGSIVSGACAGHEVDMVARKGNHMIGAELKFHNTLAQKSDLKVALYVHARFEDIKKGGRIRKTPEANIEGWLITNTSFTRNAIDYAKCVDLKMISWNYPRQGNLNELIEEARAHPVTSLTTLTKSEKAALLEKKVVLCKTIGDTPSILQEIGVRGKRSNDIISETKSLCG